MTTNPSVPTYGMNKCVVSANSNIPVSGTVSVTGAITSSAYMDRLYKNDGTELTVKFAAGSVTSAGANTLITAVANKRIVVLQMTYWVKGGNETITLQSDSTAISGAMDLLDDEKHVEPYCPHGLFRTTAGEALKVDLNTGVNFRYHITYVEY